MSSGFSHSPSLSHKVRRPVEVVSMTETHRELCMVGMFDSVDGSLRSLAGPGSAMGG